MRRPPAARDVAVALGVLLVAQAAAVGHLRGGADPQVTPVACGDPVPGPSAAVGVDAGLRVRPDLPSGGTGSGTVVVQDDGDRPVQVVALQAVVLAGAGATVLTPPEPPRHVGLALGPRDYTEQDLALELTGCDGRPLAPGFYEVAVVVHLVRPGTAGVQRALTLRTAVVVRPAP